MNVLAVLQARVSSTRLPGKVLMEILGQPMLGHQIERIQAARRIDGLTVATSDRASDDDVAKLCTELGVDCYRGNLDDVLDRFFRAAQPRQPVHVMRLTGDCPLTDPAILDALVELHLGGGFDYSSNTLDRTYPDGLDAEIFSFALLERAWQEAVTPYEREHVTPFMYAPGSGLRLGTLRDRVDRSDMRWTVDHPEDLEFVRRVYEALSSSNRMFHADDVHELLRAHPEITRLNAQHALDSRRS